MELLISANIIFRDERQSHVASTSGKRKFVARRKNILPATAEEREEARRMASGRTRLGMASEKISGRLVRGDARAGSSVSLATNWKYRGLSRTSWRPGTLEQEGEERGRVSLSRAI